jgi:CxxC motif-containing protein
MKAPTDLICICCPIGCSLHVEQDVTGFIITGNKCPRGKTYAMEEMIAPKRVVTSTVAITGGLYPVVAVKTCEPIPKDKIFAVMQVLSDVKLRAPVKVGDIVVKNVIDTEVDVVVTG